MKMKANYVPQNKGDRQTNSQSSIILGYHVALEWNLLSERHC